MQRSFLLALSFALFAAGVVGVSDYGTCPPEAAKLPHLLEATLKELAQPAKRGCGGLAKEDLRRMATPDWVIAANPVLILASWCGRKVDKDKIRVRDGWSAIESVRCGHVYAVKSSHILRPGPASLTEGVRHLHSILVSVMNCKPAEMVEPSEPLDPDVAPSRAEIPI
jgi:hypothetical protein